MLWKYIFEASDKASSGEMHNRTAIKWIYTKGYGCIGPNFALILICFGLAFATDCKRFFHQNVDKIDGIVFNGIVSKVITSLQHKHSALLRVQGENRDLDAVELIDTFNGSKLYESTTDRRAEKQKGMKLKSFLKRSCTDLFGSIVLVSPILAFRQVDVS